MSQIVLTPVGTCPYSGSRRRFRIPFGIERTGYLVTDLDGAVRAARADGADVLVGPFNDPIGRGCHHPMAGRREHAALLAHDSAVLSGAPDDSRKSRLRISRQGRCVRP